MLSDVHLLSSKNILYNIKLLDLEWLSASPCIPRKLHRPEYFVPSSQPMARRQREHANPKPGIPNQYLKRRNSDGRQPICPGSTHRTLHGPCLLALVTWYDFAAVNPHTCTINTGASYVCPRTPASPESPPFLPHCPAPKRTLTGSRTPHISCRPSIRVSAHAVPPRLQLSMPVGAVRADVPGLSEPKSC